MLVISTHRSNVITIMDGIRNPSLPKIRRQTKDANNPITAGVCLFDVNHCSRKIVINIAVSAKSTPIILNGRILPTAAPKTEPVTQYT